MDSRMQRYKFAWRLFMIANFGVGAYIFAMAKRKGGSSKSEKHEKAPPPTETSVPTVESLAEPEIIPTTPIAELVKVPEPIPEDQQRELLKWILDEKRKVKPKDRGEKKQIDEEKAILKHFIRSTSIPPF
ncbi:unnamed protein product [Amaranthus hypochondriacus]